MQVIVVGCGKVGRTIAAELAQEDNDVTVVDTDAERVDSVSTIYDVMGVVGNATSFKTLSEAGIEHTDMLIAVTQSDEVNLLCCVLAKKASDCSTIARVRNPIYSAERNFLQEELGVSMTINPEFEAAKEISHLLRFPQASEVYGFGKHRASIISFTVPEECALVGQSLRELSHKLPKNILVCMAKRDDTVIIPDGSFVTQPGDVLSIFTGQLAADEFFRRIGLQNKRIKNTLIIGGGRVSYYLAKILAKSDIDVKIIEKDYARCEELSGLLPNATIIHGDGSDQEFLKEEHIETMDSMLASTSIDEENIILSLYAKDIIRYKVITKLSHMEVDSVVKKLNLDAIVSPRSITSETIVRFVRATRNGMGSNVEVMYKMLDGRAEALEFTIHENSAVTGVKLQEMQLKKNVLIGAIYRHGKLIVPTGSDKLAKGDAVIVITTNIGFQDISDILA
ncbi:MAG: Trk system potassium transporter TrkA [Atopobiaceae bacterium]|jgi:trk system potassium uptake protein TrkA